MRTLVILRGASGSGKTTFINNNGLDTYTLSLDDMKLMYSSPMLDEDGNEFINNENNLKVWSLLTSLLEERMVYGHFTVVDATNISITTIRHIISLAKSYNYKVICVDFTKVPVEECIRRSSLKKSSYRSLPEEAIRIQHAKLRTQSIPTGIKVIKPEELMEEIDVKPLDFSSYKKIHHIGDIHGCYTALRKYIVDIKKDELYIFTGDFCDRGVENIETLNYIFSIMHLPNVLLISGNHEQYLWKYANGMQVFSREFNNNTVRQLDSAKIDKSKIKQLCKKLKQLAYYTYNEKTVLATHGGISTLPSNLQFIPTTQLMYGIGTYQDVAHINDNFMKTAPNNTYQIHGHRNGYHAPTQINERCFCLEGQVEQGGHLRIVTLDKNGFTPVEIRNLKTKKTCPASIKHAKV